MKPALRNTAYRLLKPLLQMGFFKNHPRIKQFHKRLCEETVIATVSPERKVLSGPFAGMRYDIAEAAGSVLLPKILGTYEDELHPVLTRLLQQPFAQIIDIGAAEGYYAVGFAMKFPDAPINIYDGDAYAQFLCSRNAAINNVSKNIRIYGEFHHGDLRNIDPGILTLVICDVEGGESEIFREENVSFLANSWLLIELHENDVPGITEKLGLLFAATHQLELISSRPNKKIIDYKNSLGDFALLNDEMLNERGNIPMQWALFTPLQNK